MSNHIGDCHVVKGTLRRKQPSSVGMRFQSFGHSYFTLVWGQFALNAKCCYTIDVTVALLPGLFMCAKPATCDFSSYLSSLLTDL